MFNKAGLGVKGLFTLSRFAPFKQENNGKVNLVTQGKTSIKQ